MIFPQKYVRPSDIQQDYKLHASVYEDKWRDFLTPPRTFILSHINSTQDKDDPFKLLDLGCGNGQLLSMLYAKFDHAQYEGIDISPAMIERARTCLPESVQLHHANLEKDWPVNPQRYDIILNLFNLHHLNDPKVFLKRLHSLCEHDTIIYLADFALDTYRMRLAELYWRMLHPAHKRAFSSKHLAETLEECGFLINEKKIHRTGRFWCTQTYILSAK